jgi:hypothetical protein
MKDQLNKPTVVRSEDSSGKSLHALYYELLDLREEVRDAERRSSQKARKPQERIGKNDRRF